jgi:hypothetical protein
VTYTALGITAVIAVVLLDVLVLRTRMVRRPVFWVSYIIIVFFQLITNAMFTGFGIVKYDGAAIVGATSPVTGPPPFIGEGRIAFAPVEDLLFGFALVLMSISFWIFWGRRGVDRTPEAGPPRWRRR